jgi:hypothetical protein
MEPIITKIDSGTYEILFTDGQAYHLHRTGLKCWEVHDENKRVITMALNKTKAIESLSDIVSKIPQSKDPDGYRHLVFHKHSR